MKSIDDQTDYWDKVACSKTFSHPFDLGHFCSLISKDRRILDYGCGYSRICQELWQEGYQGIVGLDTSSQMIKRGRKKNPHLFLQVLEGTNIPFEASSFDAVILFAVLTCIPTNNGQESLIQEVHRVLKPGGLLYVSDYWLQDDARNRSRYEACKDRYGIYGVFELSEGVILRHHDRTYIQGLFSMYEMIHLVDIDVLTMNNNEAKGFQYWGRKNRTHDKSLLP